MTVPRSVRVAVVQAVLGGSVEDNLDRIEGLVREAAAGDADLVVLPELFETPYFPREEREEFFSLARPFDGNTTIERFRGLAGELGLVMPISFFERDGQCFYNSCAVLDADGAVVGLYRKSHIPDGPGYEEKFYFRPGNTGFRAWPTRFGSLGVGVCWDQWFPECARAMTLAGAEILAYPTAIGSEPEDPEMDTSGPWRRVMVGHAVANAIPVAAANRVGIEAGQEFYGCSFIADHRGEILISLGDEEGVGIAEVDLTEVDRYRAGFGLFRDRRPELYSPLSDSVSGSVEPGPSGGRKA